MPEKVTGKLEVVDANAKSILMIDPDSTFIQIVHRKLDGSSAMEVTNTGSLGLCGGGNNFGARLDGTIATLFLGGHDVAGKVAISDGKQQEVIAIDASLGNLTMGGHGTDGDVVLLDTSGNPRIHLDAGSGAADATATVYLDGLNGNIQLGGNTTDGDLELRDQAGQTRIHLDAGSGAADATATVYLDGLNGNIQLGGNKTDGDLELQDQAGQTRIHLDAGGGPVDASTTVYIDGVNGDIVLKNADCAEDFDIAETADVGPGTVVVIDQEGKLQPSREAYDKRVAGVISGAGDCRPGIVLGKHHSPSRRLPVALVGKVYCQADAWLAPIDVGDLLTTSPTRGHAMKAADPAKAFGAVIGKALRALPRGQGLIPILIALQ